MSQCRVLHMVAPEAAMLLKKLRSMSWRSSSEWFPQRRTVRESSQKMRSHVWKPYRLKLLKPETDCLASGLLDFGLAALPLTFRGEVVEEAAVQMLLFKEQPAAGGEGEECFSSVLGLGGRT